MKEKKEDKIKSIKRQSRNAMKEVDIKLTTQVVKSKKVYTRKGKKKITREEN